MTPSTIITDSTHSRNNWSSMKNHLSDEAHNRKNNRCDAQHDGGHLGGSSYWAEVHDFVGGPPPPIDLDAEVRLQRFLARAASARLLASAHDCSDGGLAVALAEAAIGGPYADGPLGVEVDLTAYAPGVAAPELLYGEDGARVILSCPADRAEHIVTIAGENGVPISTVGTVAAPGKPVTVRLGTQMLSWPGATLRDRYYNAIPRRMERIQANQPEGA